MSDSTQTEYQTSIAARVAAEDIQPGEMITVLNEVIELPSFLWCCSSSLLPADEPIRLRLKPREPGKPFKVTDVCLPFVYTKDVRGKQIVFDIRNHELVRLEAETARKVWKRLKRAHQRSE